MSGYAVALAAASGDPRRAARFLAGLRGGDARQAAVFLRGNPGFLGRALTLAAAKDLMESAKRTGLPAALFAEEDLPPAPAPFSVTALTFLPDGVSVNYGEQELPLAYSDIASISAAAWDAPAPPPELRLLKAQTAASVITSAGGDAGEPYTPPQETLLRADVLAGATRLLLAPENMDFSALGPERSASSLQNLRLLLGRLRAAAPGAAVNATLAALLESAPLAPLKVDGPEAADLEVSRLLLLTSRRA
ncbi:MAG: hypothetical protein HY952_12515 [Elusimicrobia bacterium]|nr:hypothetical protein [Elusimicrobiota bacterium]